MGLTDYFTRVLPGGREYHARLDYELKLISQNNFERYFMEAFEIVGVYKKYFPGYPYSIRGSAASSLVAYMLGLTHIDPVEKEMCFSRFLNPLRPNKPDIDFDFSQRHRDQLLTILNRCFLIGRVCNKVCYQYKSSLRKALRDLFYTSREITRLMDTGDIPDAALERAERYRSKFHYYSKHCGGIVIYKKSLPHRHLIQSPHSLPQLTLNKVDLENRGVVKLDLLSNAAIAQLHSLSLADLTTYPETDPKVLGSQARKEGMVTLRENAIKKLLEGQTTFQEILRVTWEQT